MIESQYTAHELIKTLISCYNLGVKTDWIVAIV
jgi:hypothetical protein